jgi:hypothetical protein
LLLGRMVGDVMKGDYTNGNFMKNEHSD